MADETTPAAAPVAEGPGLFKTANEGGGFFRAKAGDMFVGQFKGTKDAGAQEFEGRKSRGIWWGFDLFRLADPDTRHVHKPETGPDEGKEVPASTDGRTTDETGPRSKARAWYTALVTGDGGPALTDDDFKTAEAIAAVYQRALNRKALLVFGPSQGDATKIIVTQVLPFRGTD